MFAFFDYVVQFLYSVISWFGSFIHGALSAFLILEAAIFEIIYMAGFTPFFLSASIWLTVCVFVVNYILFHNNQ